MIGARHRTGLAAGGLLLFLIAQPAWSDEAVDRLSVPVPVTFNAVSYRQSWSSHPSPDYYKQEYLPAGQTSEHFERMLLVEAIARGADVNGVVSAQVKRLNQRKATDPTVNFAILKNPQNGEVILDFVLGDDKMFIGVYGEVKRANVRLEDLALSAEQNDQIGRYLAQIGVVLLSGLPLTGLRCGLFSPAFGVCPARQTVAHQNGRSVVRRHRYWAACKSRSSRHC